MASPASAEENIAGGGASFPYVFLSQCLTDFNASQNNFNVEYTSTGSGTGKGNFTKGTFVYAQSDSKFKPGTDPSWGWTYIPNIGGAITFPINLENKNTGRSLGSAIQLKQGTLTKIMAGKITNWRDKEILKSNSSPGQTRPPQTLRIRKSRNRRSSLCTVDSSVFGR